MMPSWTLSTTMPRYASPSTCDARLLARPDSARYDHQSSDRHGLVAPWPPVSSAGVAQALARCCLHHADRRSLQLAGSVTTAGLDAGPWTIWPAGLSKLAARRVASSAVARPCSWAVQSLNRAEMGGSVPQQSGSSTTSACLKTKLRLNANRRVYPPTFQPFSISISRQRGSRSSSTFAQARKRLANAHAFYISATGRRWCGDGRPRRAY